ncbi:MAG: putative glycoside hydrolase [bacterium]|nr:putative glycoside hydrolase [bacterium]
MKEGKILIILVLVLVGIGGAIYGIIPRLTRDTYDPTADLEGKAVLAVSQEAEAGVIPPETLHLPVPPQVKAIYMSSCVAGTTNFRNDLVKLVDTTELNSIIIDIKDYTGYLSYKPEDPALAAYLSPRCHAKDMKAFIKTLHEKGIYVIGRITVFQDPLYAQQFPQYAVKKASDGSIWPDRKGIHYLDPGAQPVWNHIIKISKDSYNIGFDELNFDYIRFPSDGNMSDIAFPYSGTRAKPVVLEEFFTYLNQQLKPLGVITSADLFGMTTTSYDDLNIGQILERALPHFDYIAPMVYPSHYPPNFNGWPNPNKVPYELIKYTMDAAVKRTVASTTRINTLGSTPIASTSPQLYTKQVFDKNKIRPWLQDFDYGGTYDIAEVRAQIQATYDAGLHSWLLWAPSNRYTAGALLKE